MRGRVRGIGTTERKQRALACRKQIVAGHAQRWLLRDGFRGLNLDSSPTRSNMHSVLFTFFCSVASRRILAEVSPEIAWLADGLGFNLYWRTCSHPWRSEAR